ncbi:hypothetical protein K7432_010248 [Basidiobolus ranarum]|uniref:Uncharacterized protein n=1 Tax=Basidiobolus ranarum TaxID=34480 RepID=A0ABR2VVS8_9FUNG
MIPEGTCNVKKEVLVSSDLEFITAIIKIATEDITSDKNSLLYWDIDKTYPFDFYEDEKKLSLALGYLTEDDNGSYASNLDTGSGGVLFEEKPTKLAGFRDKLKGSIKKNLGFLLRNEKWIFDGLYLIALGHHKMKAAKSRMNRY